jgi:hypothetical protein
MSKALLALWYFAWALLMPFPADAPEYRTSPQLPHYCLLADGSHFEPCSGLNRITTT